MKKALTKDQLNHLCEIIEKDLVYTLHDRNEAYSIYINRFGHKKLVFETMVASLGFRGFINKIIPQVLDLITKQSFTENVDIFCSNTIDRQTCDSISREIHKSKGIKLTIYDLTTIRSSEIEEVSKYLDTIWKVDDVSEPVYEGAQKALFDILVSGKDSLDIKNNLIYSVIVLSIYNNNNRILIEELKKSVCLQLGKEVSNFNAILQQMAQRDIIKADKTTRNYVSLSQSTHYNVVQIVKKARIIETEFMEGFNEIISKYNISNGTKIYTKLVELYQQHFSMDSAEGFEKRADSAYLQLEGLIKNQIDEPKMVGDIINDIKKLCEKNRYLDSISATSSFLGLYRSDQLSDFINLKQKCIVLDTPLLVYILCFHSLELPTNLDWQQSQYKATRELYDLFRRKPNDVLLYTTADYINEVVGEYKKALQMGWLESFTSIDFLKRANNTFYNYYRFIIENPNLYEDSFMVNCFDDFAKELLTFKNVCIDSSSFSDDAFKDIKRQILNYYGLKLILFKEKSKGEIKKITKDYQGTLSHSKSDSACEADAKVLVYLSRIKQMTGANYSREVELYISTWDKTFDKFRQKLFVADCPNRFFITTPDKLVNKVALANFNINDTCISNDVFLFADENFGVRDKVVKFVNRAAPIFGANHKTNRFYSEVYNWYEEQVENDLDNEATKTDTHKYIESFVLLLFDKMTNTLNSDQIVKLNNDVTVDKGVRKIFLSYKKDYSSDEEVDKCTSELVKQMLLFIDSGYKQPTEAVIE